MSKRTRYILAAIVASILAIVAWMAVENLPPTPGVTQATFDRLEKGMTVAEVEGILGRTDFTMSRDRYWKCPSEGLVFVAFSETRGLSSKSWPDDDVTIVRKIVRLFVRQAREKKAEARRSDG